MAEDIVARIAAIKLRRDVDPDGPDELDGPLPITPDMVRACRDRQARYGRNSWLVNYDTSEEADEATRSAGPLRAGADGWRTVHEDVLDRAITKAMAWHPSEGGPSYNDIRSEIRELLAASPPPVEVDELRTALEPFAIFSRSYNGWRDDEVVRSIYPGDGTETLYLRVRDFRRAASIRRG